MSVRDADVDAALSEISEAVAARVREYRTTLELTIGELADRSGVSKAMLSKIENARIQPSLTTMTRIAQALRVPVTSLLRGVDDDEEAVIFSNGDETETEEHEEPDIELKSLNSFLENL